MFHLATRRRRIKRVLHGDLFHHVRGSVQNFFSNGSICVEIDLYVISNGLALSTTCFRVSKVEIARRLAGIGVFLILSQFRRISLLAPSSFRLSHHLASDRTIVRIFLSTRSRCEVASIPPAKQVFEA